MEKNARNFYNDFDFLYEIESESEIVKIRKLNLIFFIIFFGCILFFCIVSKINKIYNFYNTKEKFMVGV